MPNCDTDALVTRTLSQKGSEVVARIVERLRSNAPTLRELHWQLAILEGVVDIMADGAQTMVSTDRIEQRTFVRYCDEDYAAPCLIPLCDAPAARVFEALRTNTTLTTLNINGHKGATVPPLALSLSIVPHHDRLSAIQLHAKLYRQGGAAAGRRSAREHDVAVTRPLCERNRQRGRNIPSASTAHQSHIEEAQAVSQHDTGAGCVVAQLSHYRLTN